ncbi:hypothetical protein PVAND_016496 [Polypedilum vanderplanki]|uniref:Farnesoic acid O-methyl transferase domain-containing protein n=1 Tax=Polypedilum vanderplanki TaxID=319348 RepID=A0A9J6BGF9_POLVA|nr:hypothetical protein PVAND_016496 [Polypedilum vanderplanki]
MKLIFLFLSYFISYTVAQQAICEFGIRNVGGVIGYSCGLSVNNPEGQTITEIGGIHLEGYTDADVQGILRINGSIETAFPAIFCQRFPNIQRALVHGLNITEITDNSFSTCTSLDWLYILSNRISSISQNAFANNQNLIHIDLDNNLLSTLPENVFGTLSNLEILDLRNNPFVEIPSGAFNGLSSLQILYMQNTRLTAINPAWFSSTSNLETLYLTNNQISQISPNTFNNLQNLISLNLNGNNIGAFQAETFSGLRNLQSLSVGGNNISEINKNSFVGLENLLTLDLSGNFFSIIRNGTFRALTNLRSLLLSNSRINDFEIDAFDGLTNLTILNLNFNLLEDLPASVFAPLRNLEYCGLWSNRIKTFRRNVFGTDLSTLLTLDLDENVVNALERSVFYDATNLNRFLFSSNFCGNGIFNGFAQNRAEFMQRLERCFRNFELIIDTVTDNNVDYLFFRGENPGIVARVQAEDEIQIALTPFNFPWSPMIEVIIGAANNTRSIIRRNQDEDVAVVPSPGIIRRNQQNLFRIVWANHVILVFRENEQWPFLVHTMIDFFNVNFYGLRTLQSRATWSIQPV